jgi:pimeloyl-ACP methyl ester carboxylesterase
MKVRPGQPSICHPNSDQGAQPYFPLDGIDTDWERLTKLACDLDVPVMFTWGSDDRIGDRTYASLLQGVTWFEVPNAGHHLPLTHASVCVKQLGHRRRTPSLPDALATKSTR